jgi:3-deoxy-D-manno-octulosonic acid kinase
MIQTRIVNSYHFGFSLNLTEPQLHTLAGFFGPPHPSGSAPLDGRTAASRLQLDGVGSVVIKHYRRGGLLRHLVKRRYLKFGKTRAQREFELLNITGALGVSVPQPVAYAHKGRLFYQAWLATRAIEQSISLARLSLQDEAQARRAVPLIAEQIGLLIQNRVLHVDLHPGNVMVDGQGRVYLLDFDKGHVYRGSRERLKHRYIARWQRAIVQHRLPEALGDALRDGLKDIRL